MRIKQRRRTSELHFLILARRHAREPKPHQPSRPPARPPARPRGRSVAICRRPMTSDLCEHLDGMGTADPDCSFFPPSPAIHCWFTLPCSPHRLTPPWQRPAVFPCSASPLIDQSTSRVLAGKCVKTERACKGCVWHSSRKRASQRRTQRACKRSAAVSPLNPDRKYGGVGRAEGPFRSHRSLRIEA